MRTGRRILTSLVLMCLTFLFAPSLSATTYICDDYKELCKLGNFPVVFVGRAVSEKWESEEVGMRMSDSFRKVRLVVEKTYKGQVPSEIWAWGGQALQADGFRVGQTFLVYADRIRNDEAVVSPCSPTKRFTETGPAELKFLEGLQGRQSGSIFGVLRYTVGAGQSGTLSGRKVFVKQGNRTFSDVTDSKGRFKINGIPAGSVQPSVDLPSSFTLGYSPVTDVEAGGCTQGDIYTMNNATIRGRVSVPLGQNREGVAVNMIPVGSEAFLQTLTDSEGRYYFKGALVGDYLIGINIGSAAPQKAYPRKELPYLGTYYPGTNDRTKATPVEVRGPGEISDIDIPIPSALTAVDVPIHVSSADGAPVQKALISFQLAGYQAFSEAADANGLLVATFMRGVKYRISSSNATDWLTIPISNECSEEATVGPEDYPGMIELIQGAEFCRTKRHRDQLGWSLEGMARSGAVSVSVKLPSGAPAYNISVQFYGPPEVAPLFGPNRPAIVLYTDREGRVQAPVPLGYDLRVNALSEEEDTYCTAPDAKFRTDQAIPWRLSAPASGVPEWTPEEGAELRQIELTLSKCFARPRPARAPQP